MAEITAERSLLGFRRGTDLRNAGPAASMSTAFTCGFVTAVNQLMRSLGIPVAPGLFNR